MSEVRGIDLANDTITVEAGVILAEIQRLAADSNRLFPLSLGAEGSCQIGGNISTNAGGTQVIRYGNTRNLVLGLEVVLPDGRVWDGLRGLRKDNTGYDLKQLFIGGEGTLGIITAAVLRLFPKPSASATAWLAVPSPDAAVELLSFMKGKLGEQISAFELLQRSIIEFLIDGVPGHAEPMREPHDWYVLVEVSGQGAPGSLDDPFAEALSEAMGNGLVDDAMIATSVAQAKRYWKMREDLADAQKAAGVGIKHDISVPVSRVAEFIRRCDAALETAYPGIRHCAFGHVGDGNMHYNPVAPLSWNDRNFAGERERINRIVHDIVVELGGSISCRARHRPAAPRRKRALQEPGRARPDAHRQARARPGQHHEPGQDLQRLRCAAGCALAASSRHRRQRISLSPPPRIRDRTQSAPRDPSCLS